jgi:hypothetical protein
VLYLSAAYLLTYLQLELQSLASQLCPLPSSLLLAVPRCALYRISLTLPSGGGPLILLRCNTLSLRVKTIYIILVGGVRVSIGAS